MHKILVMGLPGAGKTTLSKIIARRLGGVHFNADGIRSEISKDLGFSLQDRIEHARRMGWLCDQVVKAGSFAIGDLICPTPETRNAFGPSFVVWLDRIQAGRFEDTNKLFVEPATYDVRVTKEGTAEYWAEKIVEKIRPLFDPKSPTALFIGRWQPLHMGHIELIKEGLERVGQACIAVRDTHGKDERSPFTFHDVNQRIQDALRAYAGRFIVIPVPNISHVFYGRDVGYSIERLSLSEEVESISATLIRSELFVR